MGSTTRAGGGTVAALAVAGALAGSAAAATPPPEIQGLIAHPRLVMSAGLGGAGWQVWTGRAQGHDQVFVVETGTSPLRIAGGPCDRASRPVRICIRGGIDPARDIVVGRLTPRVAQLSGRTKSGALMRVARARGWYLGTATSRDPAHVLIARNERGAVIARARVNP